MIPGSSWTRGDMFQIQGYGTATIRAALSDQLIAGLGLEADWVPADIRLTGSMSTAGGVTGARSPVPPVHQLLVVIKLPADCLIGGLL